MLAKYRIVETNNSDTSNLLNTHRDNTDSESERFILTREVNEQNKTYITPLTKPLEYLTRLIQGMSNFLFLANSRQSGPSPD